MMPALPPMPLIAGTRLGPYEILGALGAGGMGEVYRAKDTNLGREVALKILPELFASDPERLARFTREAKMLASLNHPNIAHVYGFEDRALVMELVEGEDLSQRLARGAIPLADVLSIARQIADALECAHEAGIIHRDLKPANIKVSDDGTVKVLDFGLAKALSPDGASGTADATNSPTLTNCATALGVILGTAAYMAPEQAKGKVVDRRADVWAFGVVVFEMLTGRRLFEGEDVSDTLAAVLTREPNWQDLPAATPPAIRRLLGRCLARDRRARLDSMASARLEIDEAVAGIGESSQLSQARTDAALPSRRRPQILAFAVVALVATGLGWFLATWLRPAVADGSSPALATPIVSSLLGPSDAVAAFHRGFALSPDGQTLVVSARSADGGRALWKRRLAQPLFERIPGTDDALYPFWSPDSRDVGFFAAGAVKRIPIAGGPAQTICRTAIAWPRASWNERDEILFSIGSGLSAGIFQVAATGGTPTKLALEAEAFSPQWVAGTSAFLYIRAESGTAQLWAATSDGSRPPQRVMDQELRDPGFALSPSGVLLFNRAGVLNAQRFDSASLAVVGTAQPIGSSAGTPRAWFGASASADALVVLAGPTTTTGGNPGDPLSRLRWVDRQGRASGELGGPGRYWTHRLSPDGLRAVVNPDKDLWIIDAATQMRSRWTTGPLSYGGAVWAPDGKRLLYREERSLWARPVDGKGAATEIVKFRDRILIPTDWSADGTRLILTAPDSLSAKSSDLFQLKVGESEAQPLLATEYYEGQGRFLPGGRWVAYASDVTGRLEVYLRPVEGEGAAVRVSSDGGDHPQFRRDGRELFYLTPTDEVVAVDLSRFETTRTPGAQQKLFRLVMNDITRDYQAPFAVSPDGQRFLVNVPEPSEPLTLIQGFRKLLAPAR